MSATVFLGGGRITSALIAGLRLAGYDRPLVVHDRNPHKLRDLKRRYGVECRPGSTRPWLRQTGSSSLCGPILFARCWVNCRTFHSHRSALALRPGSHSHRSNVWPLPCVGRGRCQARCAAVATDSLASFSNRHFHSDNGERSNSSSARPGTVVEVPENQFDVFTVTYSSSHGYHALAALARAAQDLGLDRNIAMTAAAHALADGIQYFRDSKSSLPELLQEATTPGGIAGTVMATMESGGYGKTVKRGLQAGLARARKNSR